MWHNQPLAAVASSTGDPSRAVKYHGCLGEKSFGATMSKIMQFAASNVRECVIPGAGHWIMEENPNGVSLLRYKHMTARCAEFAHARVSHRRQKTEIPRLRCVLHGIDQGDAAINVLNDFTPLVERISIDEAFADVAGCTHLFGPPAAIASTVRRRVRTELGLPISIGVARTKHLAKIASQVAKPDGLVVVDPDTELTFLHDLPVELMWGVGPVTKSRWSQHLLRRCA